MIVAFVGFYCCILFGSVIGFAGSFLYELSKEIEVSPSDQSHIAGLHTIGSAITAFPYGFISGKFGRKSGMIFGTLLDILGWLFIGFSQASIPMIMIGRLCGGLAFSVPCTAVININ